MVTLFKFQISNYKLQIYSKSIFRGCLIFSAFLLSGCLGFGDDTAVDTSGLSAYKGLGFSLNIPASWEKVDSATVTAPINGKIELALRSLVSKRGFMNNLIILSDDLQADVSASEYVQQSMLWASREYATLTFESQEQIVFDDKASSRLEIFRAKYNEVTEERLFFQTARICNKKVYLMTLGLENDTPADKYPQYKSMLASFTCQ